MRELVFGEAAAGCGRELGLDHRREPVAAPARPGGRRCHKRCRHRPPPGPPASSLALGGQVAQQRRRDHGVAAGGRADLGGADDLGVGVDAHMGFVAVKAVGGGLVPVAGLGVHRGDDPVGRGALEDPEAAVVGLLDVLAGHHGQQHGRLGHPFIQPLAPQGVMGPVGVTDQRVHQRLAGGPVAPVAGRLARRGIVVLALQPRSHLRLELRRAGPHQPPDRPPQHRDGVLGGDRVLQRRRVQHPLDPDQPHLAGQLTGHPEDPIRILRAAQPGPQIHQHRVGEAGRLLASHRIGHPGRIPPAHIEGEPVGRLPILNPSSRCSTMTTARIDGGTDRRPVGWNRSANSSGGNSRARSRARNRYTDPSGSAASHQRAPTVGSSGRRSWRPRVTARSSGSGDRTPGVCQLSRSWTNQTQNTGHLEPGRSSWISPQRQDTSDERMSSWERSTDSRHDGLVEGSSRSSSATRSSRLAAPAGRSLAAAGGREYPAGDGALICANEPWPSGSPRRRRCQALPLRRCPEGVNSARVPASRCLPGGWGLGLGLLRLGCQGDTGAVTSQAGRGRPGRRDPQHPR